MIYVFRQASSKGARELSESIAWGRRARNEDLLRRRVKAGDLVIAWGDHVNLPDGVLALNNVPLSNKFTDAEKLKAAGVPTVEVSRVMPQPVRQTAPPDPALNAFARLLNTVDLRGLGHRSLEVIRQITDVQERINTYLEAVAQPAPVAPPPQVVGEWVGRNNNHVGGNDLLNPPRLPDFYVKKEVLKGEVRIHSFLGKSIRAGVKAPREGVEQHPWVRSFDGGWRIVYDNFKSKGAQRELAAKAVEALGLQFGAVDIGIKEDGSLIVLEVNRAPGLEGGTVTAYAGAIQQHLETV